MAPSEKRKLPESLMHGFHPGNPGGCDKNFLIHPIPKRVPGAAYGHTPWRRRLAHGSLEKKYKF